MKILLIDVDSTIPNLALMKLSTYYKNFNYDVELIKCNISYYPQKQKDYNLVLKEKYHKVFISCIFKNTFDFLKINDNYGNNFEIGGTGINLKNKLPNEIYNCELDYSIYLENNISYGFITRGCIRNCYFCVVPEKEGKIKFETHPSNIIKHKKVKFMDNNILAYENHYEIIQWLVENKIKYQFNQGLDIRLINDKNSKLLRDSKYLGEYIFAFDNIKYKELITKRLKLLNWRKDWQIKFFVYVAPDMELYETIERIKYLRKMKCLPYIMRDVECWSSKYNHFYIDLASWCNQPGIFKKLTFEEFLEKRHTKKERIEGSIKLWNYKYI